MTSPENYPAAPEGSYPAAGMPPQDPYLAAQPAAYGAPAEGYAAPGYGAPAAGYAPAPGQVPPAGAPMMAPPAMPSFAAPDSMLAQVVRSMGHPKNLGVLAMTAGITLGVSWLLALIVMIVTGTLTYVGFIGLGMMANTLLAGGVSSGDGGNGVVFTSIWLLIGILVYLVTRRNASHETLAAPWILLRSFIESFAVSLILALLSLIFQAGRAGAWFPGILLYGWIVLGLALYVGRRRAVGQTALPDVLQPVWRELVGAVTPLAIFHSLVVLVFAIYVMSTAASSPFGGGSGALLSFLIILSVFPTLLLVSFDLAIFGTLTFGPLSAGLVSMIGGWSWLIIVLNLLVLVIAAVQVGVRRQRTASPQWMRVWQLPVAAFVLSLFLLPTIGILSGSSSALSDFGLGRGEMSITPIGILLITLAFALISVLAEFMPAVLYSISPGLVSTLAGRKHYTIWINAFDPATGIPAGYVAPVAPAPAAPAQAAPAGDQYGYAQPVAQPGAEQYGYAQPAADQYGYGQPVAQPGAEHYGYAQPAPEQYGYAQPAPEQYGYPGQDNGAQQA